MSYYESDMENVAIRLLEDIGYEYILGPDIGPESDLRERNDYREIVLLQRLKDSLGRINSHIRLPTLNSAAQRIVNTISQSMIESNHYFHRMLVEGVDVEYQGEDGSIVYDKLQIIDFSEPLNNEFLVVNQFTV